MSRYSRTRVSDHAPRRGGSAELPPARGGGQRGAGAGHTRFAPAGRAGLAPKGGPGWLPNFWHGGQPSQHRQARGWAPRPLSSETHPPRGSGTSGAAARLSGGTSSRASGGRGEARPLAPGTERRHKFRCACLGCPRPIGALPSTRSPEGRARADGPGEAAPSLPVSERPAALRCRPARQDVIPSPWCIPCCP